MANESWQCGGCKKWYPPSKEECSCSVDNDGVGVAPQPYTPPYQPYPYIEPLPNRWPYLPDVGYPIWYFGDRTGKYPNSSGVVFKITDNTTHANIKFEPWRTTAAATFCN